MNKKWFLFSPQAPPANENNRVVVRSEARPLNYVRSPVGLSTKSLLNLSISNCLIEKNKNFVRPKLFFSAVKEIFTSSLICKRVSLNIVSKNYFKSCQTSHKKNNLCLFSSKDSRVRKISPVAALEKNTEFGTQNDFERNLFNELQLRPTRQGEHLPTLNEKVGLLKKNQSEYRLETFVRSNQDTCLTHKPSVVEGDWVQSGDFLTDCANSVGGELSLGQNIFIAYMPWEGYNFEDAILISERLVTDDLFTSVHIERYEIENLQKNRPPVKATHKKLVREKLRRKKLEESLPPFSSKTGVEAKTSLGKNPLETNGISNSITKKSKPLTPQKVSLTSRTPRYEEITRNIPDVSPIELSNLDAFGIVKLGSFVEEGDILVGKISPINKKDFTPYQKLLYTILNKQILPYRDSSLRAPKGIKAKVIDIKIFMKPGTVSYSSKVLQNNHSILMKKRKKRKKGMSIVFQKDTQGDFGETSRKHLSLENQIYSSPLSGPTNERFNKNQFKSPEFFEDRTSIEKNLGSKLKSNLLKMSRKRKNRTNKYMLSTLIKRTSLSSQAPATNKIRSFLLNSSNLSFLDVKSIPLHSVSSRLARKTHKMNNSFVESSSVLKPFLSQPLVAKKSSFSKNSDVAKTRRVFEAFSSHFTTNTEYFNINKYAEKPHKRNQFNRKNLWQNKNKSVLVQIDDSRSVKQLKNLYKNDIFLEKHSLLKQEQLYDSQSIKNIETIHIYLAEKRKVQVGDKMSGRHGNKGIVSQILPLQDMPFLPDGTPIDMVLNPLGVPSRMNVGQIYECLLGLAGRYLGENYKIFAFDEIYGAEASRSFVFNKLYEASCKTGFKWLFNPKSPGKIRLFDGRSGDCFHQPVTVGEAYMLRLVHMVDDKIHMRSTGPYSLVTQQPLRGRSKQGGQRLGEMEVWALEGYGAAFTLLEMLTVKSDDLTGRMTLWSNLILNKDLTIGTPEAFKVLICELQALCLDIGLFRYNTNNDIIIKKDENKTLEDRPLLQSRQKKSLKEMTSLMSFP